MPSLSTALGPHWPRPPTTRPQALTQSVVGVGEVGVGLLGDLAGDASLDKRHWKELLFVIIVVHTTALPVTAEHSAAYVILWGWGKGWGIGQGDNTCVKLHKLITLTLQTRAIREIQFCVSRRKERNRLELESKRDTPLL